MLKITNKLINTKEKKKRDKLKKIITLKKNIRLKFVKYFPLSNYEQTLYSDNIFSDTIAALDNELFFYSTGNIFMLDIYPKSNFYTFTTDMEKLLLENPSKNMLTRSIINYDFKEILSHFQSSNNHMARANIGFCTPKEKNLNNIIDYIEIEIFNFSNDYFGINFNIILSKDMVSEINNCIHSTSGFDCDSYHKYAYNKKKHIGKSSCSPELIKRELLREKIVEIKMRTYKFISKYIKLSEIKTYSPISLDTYYSNIEDTTNRFLHSFDMDFTYSKKHSNLTLVHNKKEDQEYIEHDFFLDLNNNFKHINRSNGLMILDKENRYKEIYVMSNELTNIFIFILYSNLLHELNELISEERNLIEHSYNKFGIIFNNIYSKLNKKIFRYKLIFNEISESNGYFTEPYLKEHFEYLNKYYKEILDKHSLIENASKDKINISNYNVSFWLSIISIVVATIAFITSLFYDSSLKYKNEINKVQQEQQNIYMELNNIYNEEKDLNNKLTNIIN